MKTTGLTLSEALATGRPFRHKTWSYFLDPSNENNPRYAGEICMSKSVYEPVWEVQPEEIAPMRVLTDSPINSTIDLKDLAKALAPYLNGD